MVDRGRSSDKPDIEEALFGFIELAKPGLRRLVLLLGVVCAPFAGAADDGAAEALGRTFELLDTRFLAPERNAAAFPAAERARLERIARTEGLAGLAPALDARLRALGTSHTRFLADEGFDHAFYRSLFDTRDPDAPALWHLRALLTAEPDGAVRVVDVPEGGPAANAGLRRGDALRRADGSAFLPTRDLASGEALTLRVQRGGSARRVRLVPEYSNPHRALIEATRASVRVLEIGERRVGYIHLWTGTHEEVLDILDAAVLERFADVDGVLFDLRGGFGGAWHDHLDPFFAARDDFFTVTSVDRDGEITELPTGPRRDVGHYDGPLVVLIDAGVRSGKEALAYQFRRSGRGLLVGETTAGAFTAGLGTPGEGWFLYLAVAEPRLDGVPLEGRGVAPHVPVPWPLDSATDIDPQLAEARRRLLACLDAPDLCRPPRASAEG